MFKGFGRKKKPVLGDNELFTGITQHPVTGRWQTWISFTGNDIQCITAHNNQDDADKVARAIADAWREGKYKTSEETTAFIKSLPTDGPIDPLPQNIVMQLSKQVFNSRK
ncbi:hypothetical protein H6G54_02800 [Anabaena cylindrica FACHB-243]|uniref:Uncharacterized protein n=1 Tax=Anabaena cylindrica (strain ATCC 27899 / PCC 7122) TaxID=272123 RepID=K9ZSA9_ANACC|nr:MULTISPECIES: hypothetical protein [Anabaena]AFZ61230.1 hypothetical protein Anacy_5946 [Anabaena cylindrica PCC 7122]AZL96601.1 hypothetical protein [Anabaena sp. CCAP 1446/1C]MBD2416656.1 hypothetical protein [Anabaena cylindrica FACHB-243]MBY5281106.1 hypothetical protein [Anabaena sp. CCAP 1446/1C]MBY5306732.1 hypothetical protein [Anabaena sp. CCAP 1446/1C]